MKKTCLSFPLWHDKCGGRQIASGYGGMGIKIVCLKCGVMADLEAISEPISVSDSYTVKKGLIKEGELDR